MADDFNYGYQYDPVKRPQPSTKDWLEAQAAVANAIRESLVDGASMLSRNMLLANPAVQYAKNYYDARNFIPQQMIQPELPVIPTNDMVRQRMTGELGIFQYNPNETPPSMHQIGTPRETVLRFNELMEPPVMTIYPPGAYDDGFMLDTPVQERNVW